MLTAGTAEVEITPPIGTPLAGYFAPRISTRIHDSLFARALVLDDGNTRIGLVSCDLIAIKASTVNEARRLIRSRCGIPDNAVMIACSHTHTGPYTSRIFGCGPEPDYMAALPGLIAGAVCQASENAREARIGFGTGAARGISFIRRYVMRRGGVRTNPGIGNPEALEPASPLDDSLGVVKVERADGSLLAAWVNFAVHGDVVTGDEISADYPGVLSALLRRGHPRATVLFANGCCGDINHIDVNGPPVQEGFAHAEMMGAAIAAEVSRVIASTPVSAELRLSCIVEPVELLRRVVPSQALQAARKLLAEHNQFEANETAATSEDLGSLPAELAYARELVELAAEPERVDVAEVQAMRIGSAAIVAVPAELFCEIGLEIKKHSPANPTFVVGYANGMVGYIPTEKAFSEGGYETRLARSSKLAPEAAGLVIATAERALSRLAPH